MAGEKIWIPQTDGSVGNTDTSTLKQPIPDVIKLNSEESLASEKPTSSRWSVGVIFETSSFTSKDSLNGGSAQLTSGLSSGAQGKYELPISNSFDSIVALQFLHQSYTVPPGRLLDQENKNYFSFQLGLNNHSVSDFTYGFRVGIEELPIISSSAVNHLIIQPFWSGKIGAEVDYQWLKFSAFDLDVLLEGELYLPRNNSLFHLDTSSSQQVGIPITKPFGAEQNLKLVPFFRHADLRTSIESQNEWDLGINLFFDWNTK